MPISRIILFLIAALLSTTEAQTTLIGRNAIWKYRIDGTDLGTAWRERNFVDSTWFLNFAPLGYGGGETTTLAPPAGTVTTYFRRHFNVTDTSAFSTLTLRVRRDDAAVVWLNGELIFSSDFPGAPPDANVPAPSSVSGAAEEEFIAITLTSGALVAGDNVMAVEIHQAADAENDLIFDLELTGGAIAELVRGPYLQQATSSGITVRWRTDRPVIGKVRYGHETNQLSLSASETVPTTEHIIPITGLAPDTRYFYAIEDAAHFFAGGTPDYYFTTYPVPGTVKPFRVWILGDSGTGSYFFNDQPRRVASAYKHSPFFKHADVWLMLGDNAYGGGFDAEYQRAVFDVYPDFLRNTTLWSTMGNHETYNGEDPLPYYQIFTFPTNGEAGGMASGSEHYYSFDYANVHFVCLDSQTTEMRMENSAMMQWLEADLAATSQKWIIAFWHHPPYTKGSHDSDWEWDSIEMRERFVPILEAAGVDLVLSGHSHNYERSCLLNGHYGISSTLIPSMQVNPGLGRIGENGGAYLKAPIPHNGAVYTVAGHSGQAATYAPVNHPAHVVNWSIMGSMFLDINGDRLDARMIDINGIIRDWFTIEKVAPVAVPAPPANPPPHDAWRIAHFVENANVPDIAGDLADPDHDGIPNLIERAFGLDPNVSSVDGLPCAALSGDTAITFCRPSTTADLRYVVQFSTDLVRWTDGSSYHGADIVPNTAITEQVSIVHGDSELITVRAKPPDAGFLRVAVRRD